MNDFTISIALIASAALFLSFIYSIIWLLLQKETKRQKKLFKDRRNRDARR